MKLNLKLKSKKGQMEIMGLVIVVILISLGMLFLLRFVIFDSDVGERARFTRSELAANTLNAMMLAQTECQGLDMTALIQDCASLNSVECPGNRRSCDFLEDKASFILENTLLQWRKHFVFTIEARGSNLIEIQDEVGCSGSQDKHSQPFSGGVLVELAVCD